MKRGRKKRDLSYEVALGKVAGLKPHAVHFQMARLLNELVMGRRLTTEERKHLYHNIAKNDAYNHKTTNISVTRKNIKYNKNIIYQTDIIDKIHKKKNRYAILNHDSETEFFIIEALKLGLEP